MSGSSPKRAIARPGAEHFLDFAVGGDIPAASVTPGTRLDVTDLVSTGRNRSPAWQLHWAQRPTAG